MIILLLFISLGIPLSFGFWLFHYIASMTLYNMQEVTIVSPKRWLTASFLPVIILVMGYRSRSLTISGAIAGYVVGFILTLSNLCFCTSLIAFFVFGSISTKFRSRLKRRLETNYKEGGQRNWIQVLSNGGAATQLAVFYISEVGCFELPLNFSRHYMASVLSVAVMSAIACCCGDTLASEIGSVFGSAKPRLITTFRHVPKGTNGGVSIVGALSSILGGALVGLSYTVTLYLSLSNEVVSDNPSQWMYIIFGAIAGFLGSLIDSILGATLQYSGYNKQTGQIVEVPGDNVKRISGHSILDNHGVNFVSSMITAVIMPFIAFQLWQYS